MGFRRSDLQEAFLVPGTYAFRVWGYGTTNSLEEVLAEHYFRDANAMLQPSELIYVSIQPRARADRPEGEDARVALVMVRRRCAGHSVSPPGAGLRRAERPVSGALAGEARPWPATRQPDQESQVIRA